MSTGAVILILAACVLGYLLLRFVVNAGVNKGADVIQHAVAERKNEKIEEENEGPKRLADRYAGL